MKREIEKILDHYFPDPQIPLYHLDPFTLLVAVLLSAQCQDERVNQVTKKLFVKAKTPQEFADISLHALEKILCPLGLFRTKAKNIIALSKIILHDYGGVVPATLGELMTLPGVGRKTASVVLVQAFHKPAFPVDTHILRSANRWGLSKAKTPLGVEEDLKKLFPAKKWGKIHLQIILFARKYCQARRHQRELCPICLTINCEAYTDSSIKAKRSAASPI